MADDEEEYDFRPKKPSAKPLATGAGSAQTTSASFQTVSLEEGEWQADEADPSALAARAWSSSNAASMFSQADAGAEGAVGGTGADHGLLAGGAFIQFADDDDSGSESGYSEASTVMRRFSVGSWQSLQFADFDDCHSESGYLKAFKKLSVQKAVHLYINELHEKIIFQADNATLFAQTIKKHRAREEETIGPGLLLERRPSEVYGKDFSSWPAKKPILTAAATFGRTKIVVTLIEEFKCDINVRRAGDSNTALHLAGYYGHDETVDALLKMGADCLSPNNYGESPQQAVQKGALHWLKGEKKHMYEDPFFVCFRKTGRNPEHTKCDALLLAHIQYLKQQEQVSATLGSADEGVKQRDAALLDDDNVEQQKQAVRESFLSESQALSTPGSWREQAVPGGREVCDSAGAVRIRIPPGGVTARLGEGEWHEGLDLSASVVPITEEMRAVASSSVNVLSRQDTQSSIIIAGEAIKFGPPGTLFQPTKVELFLPIDQGLIQGLRELEVPFSVGAFRWNEGDERWEEKHRAGAEDATGGDLRVEVEGFSTWVAGLVFRAYTGLKRKFNSKKKPKASGHLASPVGQQPPLTPTAEQCPRVRCVIIGPKYVPHSTALLHLIIYSHERDEKAQLRSEEILAQGQDYIQFREDSFLLAWREEEYEAQLREICPQEFFEIVKKEVRFHWFDGMAEPPKFAFKPTVKAQDGVNDVYFETTIGIVGMNHMLTLNSLLQRSPSALCTPREGLYSKQQAIACTPAKNMNQQLEMFPSTPGSPGEGSYNKQTAMAGTVVRLPTSTLHAGATNSRSPTGWDNGSSTGSVGDWSPGKAMPECRVVFFSCRVGTKASTEQESQKLKDIFELVRPKLHTITVNSQPTIANFSQELSDISSRAGARTILHFAGHTEEEDGGLFWFEEGKKATNKVQGKNLGNIVKLKFKSPESLEQIECVFLNACHTLPAGLHLCHAGISHVVCWLHPVKDSVGRKFAEIFYRELSSQPDNYVDAFEMACNEQQSSFGDARPCLLRAQVQLVGSGAVTEAVEMWCDGARVPVPMGLRETEGLEWVADQAPALPPASVVKRAPSPDSEGGDEEDQERERHYAGELFSEGGTDGEGDDNEMRNWRPPNPQRDDDFAALAGQEEQGCLKALGFDLRLSGKPISIGNGIMDNGFITDDALRQLGVQSYGMLWGPSGAAVQKAFDELLLVHQGERDAAAGRVERAVSHLKRVELLRQKDIDKHQAKPKKDQKKHEGHVLQLQKVQESTRAMMGLLAGKKEMDVLLALGFPVETRKYMDSKGVLAKDSLQEIGSNSFTQVCSALAEKQALQLLKSASGAGAKGSSSAGSGVERVERAVRLLEEICDKDMRPEKQMVQMKECSGTLKRLLRQHADVLAQ